MNQRMCRQRGQAMTEYIIVVALIAIAAIAVYQSFGHVVRAQTTAMARELAGEDGTAHARSAAKAAPKGGPTVRTLNSFTGNGGKAASAANTGTDQ